MLHGGLRQEKREHLLLGDAPLDVTEPLRLLERRVQLLRRHAAPLGQLLDPAVEPPPRRPPPPPATQAGGDQIGRAHAWNPVTIRTRIPSSSFKKKKKKIKK